MSTLLALPLLLALPARVPAPQQQLRAAVLEHADRWTNNATGLAEFLEESGFEIVPLDSANWARVDLIAVGSFANNHPSYERLVRARADQLQRFVAAGGVYLEFAQSDQFDPVVSHLPDGITVCRGDADDDPVLPAATNHALVEFWPDEGHRAETLGLPQDRSVSWEGIEQWDGARRLLSAGSAGDRRAALVEAAHGQGRYLLSSLWIDKLITADGSAAASPAQRDAAVAFGRSLVAYVVRVRAGDEPAVIVDTPPPRHIVGPMLGHVDHHEAHVWMRAATAGLFDLVVTGPTGARTVRAKASPDSDLCLQWQLDELEPATEYSYEVRSADGRPVALGRSFRFHTAPAPDSASRVKLAFGSCASSDPSSVWSAIELANVDGLLLMGDTPYIDTTDLATARRKHREFLQVPELARLGRETPIWGTWDDHDFGGNDTDGTLPGKQRTRQAFVEYRALREFGDGSAGIYTSLRHGGLEVFLLDTRYFARTEAVSTNDSRPTLLGRAQWRWLERALTESTAPFKVIACGMIWDDKQNTESDDWGHYPHERERLERFLGEQRISGAILLGGDIHVSRHLSYPESKSRVGYVLDQVIVSPLHARVIPSLDTPHPALRWSAREPQVFLTLTADTTQQPATLTARWHQDIGRGAGLVLYETSWTTERLSQ